jgi:hypothetical protein
LAVHVRFSHALPAAQSFGTLQQPAVPADVKSQMLSTHVRVWHAFPVGQLLGVLQQPPPPFDVKPHVLLRHVRVWHKFPVGQVNDELQQPGMPFDVKPQLPPAQVRFWHPFPVGQSPLTQHAWHAPEPNTPPGQKCKIGSVQAHVLAVHENAVGSPPPQSTGPLQQPACVLAV